MKLGVDNDVVLNSVVKCYSCLPLSFQDTVGVVVFEFVGIKKKVFLAYFMTLCSIYSDNNKFLYLFDFILYLVAWNNDTHVICVLQLL